MEKIYVLIVKVFTWLCKFVKVMEMDIKVDVVLFYGKYISLKLIKRRV